MLLILSFWFPPFLWLIVIYALILFIDSSIKNKSAKIGFISVFTGFIQLLGYGTGFIRAFWSKVILKKELESRNKIKKMYNKEN